MDDKTIKVAASASVAAGVLCATPTIPCCPALLSVIVLIPSCFGSAVYTSGIGLVLFLIFPKCFLIIANAFSSVKSPIAIAVALFGQ